MCTTVRHSKTAVAEGERPLSHFLIQVHIHTKRMEARINYNAWYGIWSYTLLLNGNYCCIKRRSVDLLFSQGIRFGTKEVHKSSASTTKQCKYLARYDSLCVSRYLRSAQPLVNCKWSGLLDFSLTYITPIYQLRSLARIPTATKKWLWLFLEVLSLFVRNTKKTGKPIIGLGSLLGKPVLVSLLQVQLNKEFWITDFRRSPRKQVIERSVETLSLSLSRFIRWESLCSYTEARRPIYEITIRRPTFVAGNVFDRVRMF